MTIEWQPRARKDFDRLEAKLQQRIASALDRLGQTGKGDTKKLSGVNPPQWRLRVGEMRVRYSYDAGRSTLIVLRVLPRGDAYR